MKKLKVGQKWRCRGGAVLTITEKDKSDTQFPFYVTAEDCDIGWVTKDGRYWGNGTASLHDLVELIEDSVILYCIQQKSGPGAENWANNKWHDVTFTSSKKAAKKELKECNEYYTDSEFVILKLKIK